jgi:hypothetical protein
MYQNTQHSNSQHRVTLNWHELHVGITYNIEQYFKQYKETCTEVFLMQQKDKAGNGSHLVLKKVGLTGRVHNCRWLNRSLFTLGQRRLIQVMVKRGSSVLYPIIKTPHHLSKVKVLDDSDLEYFSGWHVCWNRPIVMLHITSCKFKNVCS